MKKVLPAFLISILIATIVSSLSVLGYVMAMDDPKVSIVHESVRKQMSATCKVTAKKGGGTGALLGNGLVLTAAHVVDDNMDGKLSLNEREVVLEFFGDSQTTYSGRVLLMGENADYAIVETLASDTIEGVTIAEFGPKIGEPVYTIGCSMGFSPLVAAGYVGDTSHGSKRTSCYITKGNSGGLLYRKESGEALGIMVKIDIRSAKSKAMYRVPMENGVHFGFAYGQIHYEMNALSSYVSIADVMSDLDGRNAKFVMSGKEEGSPLPSFLWVNFGMSLMGMVLCVFVVRKHILG